MIMLHPLAARVKKPVGIFWSGLFAIKPPNHLCNKENQGAAIVAALRNWCQNWCQFIFSEE
jgi:hypothetical protein